MQLRPRTTMELMSFLPVSVGDVPEWGHGTVGRGAPG